MCVRKTERKTNFYAACFVSSHVCVHAIYLPCSGLVLRCHLRYSLYFAMDLLRCVSKRSFPYLDAYLVHLVLLYCPLRPHRVADIVKDLHFAYWPLRIVTNPDGWPPVKELTDVKILTVSKRNQTDCQWLFAGKDVLLFYLRPDGGVLSEEAVFAWARNERTKTPQLAPRNDSRMLSGIHPITESFLALHCSAW